MLVELVSTVEAKSVDLLDAELNDDGDDGWEKGDTRVKRMSGTNF